MINKSECAKELGVSRTTLDRLIADGDIKCYVKKEKVYVKALFDEKYIESVKKKLKRDRKIRVRR